MAFSDEQELIDQIRHDLRMEDDSGMCTRVVLPEQRRAKYGGLPLNFRSATSSDDEDEPSNSGYCGYEIPLIEESVLTKEIIDGRLRSRTVESTNSSGQQTLNDKDKDSGELFVAQDVEKLKDNAKNRSAVSIFVNENAASLDNPLLEYARFEAVGEQPSKSILVLYADANDSGGDVPSIRISVQPTAKVGEVVGYCLYRFFTKFGIVLGDNAEDFKLLMADDGGEVERDLPPLDKSRAIGDLGFTVLALVSSQDVMDGESKSTYSVVVYLPTSQQFLFELDHLDHTLEWLRDESLKRKEMEEEIERLGLMPEMEYDLEDINVFGKSLNLNQSIANSGCTEFVLVRKFSSRGDFHPRGMFRQKSTALLSPLSKTSSCAVFDFGTPRLSVTETPCISPGVNSPVFFVEDDEVIMSFRVTRLHRMKKNWPATMSIRYDRFDILPLSNNRRSFLPNTYQKPITVPWNYLCEVKAVQRDSEHTSILSIVWLPVENPATLVRIAPPFEEQISLRYIAQYYEDRTWKIVHIEFESPGKALQAKNHMVDVIQALNSSAFQAYQHSSNGARYPSEAAESALMQMADGLLPSSSSTRSSKSSTIRKLSRIRRALTTWKD